MVQRRGHFHGYQPPGVDSARARANATLFLCGAVSVEEVTTETLAHQYRLKPKTAEYLLIRERQRRAANGF